MAHPKTDSQRRSKKTRNSHKGEYNNYSSGEYSRRLKSAIENARHTNNISGAANKFGIPRATLQRLLKQFKESGAMDVGSYTDNRSQRLHVLSAEEEKSAEDYCLWESDHGQNVDNAGVKCIIREINALAIERGEKRKSINTTFGPSAKYMREFYKRHPKLTNRMAEHVDQGRINMANQDNIDQYFQLVQETFVKHGIMEVDENGNIVEESLKSECIYMADETGWGVQTKTKKVVGRKGAKHIYTRKSADESHKTLMLGVCGNGDTLKSLVILEKSFPLIGEGEAEHLPENILLSKTTKGSMEKNYLLNG